MSLDQQRGTIAGHWEKLSQQQSIIQQQLELERNKRDLLQLDRLLYEMTTLKKWAYGIKSEKHHQPTSLSKASAGDQLQLSMEVDSWGVCKVSSLRKIQEHYGRLKPPNLKNPVAAMIFPKDFQKRSPSWMWWI